MEDIIARLFDLFDSVDFAGAVKDEDRKVLENIQNDYSLAKEAIYTIKCPNCGTTISF